MTVAALPSTASYVEDGVSTSFPVPFRFGSSGDLIVERIAAGVATVLVPGVDYAVTGGSTDAGGTLVRTAATSGATLRIARRTARAQPMVYTTNDRFPAKSHEEALDRAMLIAQELDASVSDVGARALTVPLGEIVTAPLPVAAARAGKALIGLPDGSFGVAALGDGADPTLRPELASDDGALRIGWRRAGIGAVIRSIAVKVTEALSVLDFGAGGRGLTDDTTALVNSAVAARIGMTDGLRTFAGEIRLPPGRYRISDVLDLAPTAGLAGLTITGSGAGSTEIVFTTSDATIRAKSSRAVTFRDIAFRSLDPAVDGPLATYGVDMNQTAFTIDQVGNPLRSWRFERCDFAGFYRCFHVTGTSMCSEFYFDKCQFSQCYMLLDNENDQAVNWNFVSCNWENEALDTSKDKNLAAAFRLQAGTLVNWTGGSLIFWGSLVYYNLTAGNRVQATSHAMTFDGVRMELVDGGAGSHAPIINRVEVGYVSGGNSPVVTFANSAAINRGAIPPSNVYAKLWNNCTFTFVNNKFEGGRIVGILDGLTTTSNGAVLILNTARLDYVEDTTSRVSDHDAHAVTIVPPYNGAEGAMMADVRPSSLAAPASVSAKYVTVRGPTGSLPLAGTSVALDPLPVHSTSLRLFIHSYDVPGVPLTMELRDQADTTTYATVTLAAGAKVASADAPGEIGFQIPAVPLALKFSGTAQVLKGICGWEYL